LRSLSVRLADANVRHALVVEADAPYAGQAMAIGIEPMDRKLLKPLLSSYPLARHAPLAQPDRAVGVMTRQVGSLNLSGRATSPRGLFQRIRRWLGGKNSQPAPR
jgi:hypothetical protein